MVGARGEDERRPPSRLLMAGLGREIQPDQIAPLGRAT